MGDAKRNGRPPTYRPEYAEQAKKLCKLGATDRELADFFNVCESTVNVWKIKEDGFMESLKRGKEESDLRVVNSLYQRAVGYTQPEEKVFNHEGKAMIVPTVRHIPADVTAARFWLKNRQPAKWTDQGTDTNVILGSDFLTELQKAQRKNEPD